MKEVLTGAALILISLAGLTAFIFIIHYFVSQIDTDVIASDIGRFIGEIKRGMENE